ncbi:MAG: hypothetical protein CVU84_00980 [Firmicutes bacterium HGW-Firmicutes-1]|jgi:CRP-like cAMP-binding protein|nr:MAG: hypothetical protein CVU84_00980 [Firmicutes bacterium HGW-Firmicutes-1]
MDIFRQLQKSPLLLGKSYEEMKTLFSSFTYSINTYKQTEIIFNPSMPLDKLGIILQGSISLHKILSSGESIFISKKTVGEALGIECIYATTEFYPYTFISNEKTIIILMHRNDFSNLLAKDTQLMINFMKSMYCENCSLNKKIDILCQPTIKSKIVHYLLTEYADSGKEEILLPFSKKTWAECLNVQPPSLSRTLTELQTEGLISTNKRIVYLKDIDSLYQLLY